MTKPAPKVWLVTGSNRGIGLTFCTHLSTSPSNIVLACVRSLKNSAAHSALLNLQSHSRALHILECDTGSVPSIEALPSSIKTVLEKEGVSKVDFVLNNAAINSVDTKDALDMPEKEFLNTMSVNVLGPAKVVEAVVKGGLIGEGTVVMNMTSGLGSISLTLTSPRAKSSVYSISKAAVNMLSVHQARLLEEKGVVVVCVDPGWVKTDMGGEGAFLEPDESVGAMLKLLTGLKKSNSGKFYRYNGEEITW